MTLVRELNSGHYLHPSQTQIMLSATTTNIKKCAKPTSAPPLVPKTDLNTLGTTQGTYADHFTAAAPVSQLRLAT